MTVEDTFDLLADAAQVRYPYPDRENRGLCPAHDDHNNPGLVFRISPTSDKLITHCFAQECTAEDIATAIGLPLSSFFPGHSAIGQIKPKIEWQYVNALELLKLLPLGYSWDEQIEATFRTLAADQDIGYLFDLTPLHDIPFIVMRDVYLWSYVLPHWQATSADWWTYEHDGYSDQAMRRLSELSRTTRTNDLSTESAIPRRSQ